MSASTPTDNGRLPIAIPEAWRAFLSSGEYAGARASIHAGGSEVLVDVVARLEFTDDHNLAIHVALADGAPSAASDSARAAVRLLTARERAVITLIAMGLETPEIAKTLYISPSTVRTHVRNSMSKLGVHTRAQLVAAAMVGRGPVQSGDAVDSGSSESSG